MPPNDSTPAAGRGAAVSSLAGDRPQVYAQAPYSTKGTKGRTTNAQDGIYQGGGQQLLLALTQDGQGFATPFDIGVQIA